MTSGKPIGKKEDQYIKTHRKGLFASKIAENLVIMFPDENGGSRDKESVKRYMRRKGYI